MILRDRWRSALKLGVAAGALALSIGSEAGVIGSLTTGSGWGLVIGKGVLAEEVNLRFAVSDAVPSCWTASPPNCYVLLDQALTAADIGRTFQITPANNSAFPGIAAKLTDGLEDMWMFSLLPQLSGAVGIPVAGAFPNGGGPDFRGHTVTEVDLTINALEFRQVILPSGPGISDVFTQVSPNLTITVLDAAVPEPGSLTLVGGGAVLFVAVACKRYRRRRDCPQYAV